MFTRWLQGVVKGVGGPILFLSGLYAGLGATFIWISPPVGAVLLGTGIVIIGLFVLLAYRLYRQEHRAG